MVEVDAVRDAPDHPQGGDAECARHEAARLRGGHDHSGGRERDGGEPTLVQPLGRQTDVRHEPAEHPEPDEAREVEPAGGPLRAPEHVPGDDRAGEQLGGPGERAVVAEAGAATRESDDDSQCGRDDPQTDEEHAEPGPTPTRDDPQHDERQDDVELLLDRQAPEVHEWRRRGEERGIRAAVQPEPPVGDVADGADDIAPKVGSGAGEHRSCQKHHERNRDERAREQAAGAPRPEALQRDGAGGRHLGDEQRADQEPRQGEEHRHADEATAHLADPGVEEQHGEHREAAKAVESGRVGQAHGALPAQGVVLPIDRSSPPGFTRRSRSHIVGEHTASWWRGAPGGATSTDAGRTTRGRRPGG